MKFLNLAIGVLLFSLVVSLIFGFTGDLSSLYGSSQASDFDEMGVGGELDFVKDISADENSNIREISGSLEEGQAASEDSDINLVTGALSGGRLIKNSLTNISGIINIARNKNTLIPPVFFNAIWGIIIIFVIIVILHFVWKARLEA